MLSNRLYAASWACFLSAFLGAALLPSFMFTQGRLLQIGIPIISWGLYAFYMMTLKSLLKDQNGNTKAALPVSLLIIGFAGYVLASILDEIHLALLAVAVPLVLASSILVGASSILLAFRLFQMKLVPGVLGIAFSILLITEGLCFGSVYLIPVGILVAVLSDLVLGLIFREFAMKRQLIAEYSTAS